MQGHGRKKPVLFESGYYIKICVKGMIILIMIIVKVMMAMMIQQLDISQHKVNVRFTTLNITNSEFPNL
jgi:hypothetical protein